MSNVTSVKYSVPAPEGVVTHETLNNVKLADERIDSMVPQGLVATDQVIWQGGPGLSPTLSATNLASAERQNKDAFWAGLLYGIAAALAVPFLQEFYKEWQKWQEERIERAKGRLRPQNIVLCTASPAHCRQVEDRAR